MLLAKNIDPNAAKKGQKVADETEVAKAALTFKRVALEWYEKKAHTWPPVFFKSVGDDGKGQPVGIEGYAMTGWASSCWSLCQAVYDVDDIDIGVTAN